MKKMLRAIKNDLSAHLTNSKGWSTKRKLIVFESDDWGSIRMESASALKALSEQGFEVYKSSYNKYDSLEQQRDIEGLFDVVQSYKDSRGRPAVFTVNMVMANPDFDKIKSSGYTQYFYEDFDTTYQRKYDEETLPLWKQGITNNLVMPGFHAREHVNVHLWLKALQAGDKNTLKAFDHNFFGHQINYSQFGTRTLLAAYDVKDNESLNKVVDIVNDGLQIFERKFNFKASTFIACNYIWPVELEEALASAGISGIQSRRVQSVPTNAPTYSRRKHFTGQLNKENQIYTVRNCYFEPSSGKNKDWVASCLKEISLSFFYGRPAIISCHRLNFIGSLNDANRDNGLRLLDSLLKKITQRWPDVEFLSSVELEKVIRNSLK